MNAITFDTHGFVKRLTAAGMPEAQAEVLADEQTNLIENNLASKRDLKELEVSLKSKLREMEQRIVIRLGTMIIIAVGAIVTLDKVL